MDTEGPEHTGFMDPDMLDLWNRMEPLPGDLRLYGGTALALYLNHRRSTAFDFATPEPVVSPSFAADIPWLAGAECRGGPGMVDASILGSSRRITITLMECGHLIPMPVRPPIPAPNGVLVAHPADLIAAKIEACFTRAALRDYADPVAAADAWPNTCRAAAHALPGRTEAGVARIIAMPPREVASELGPAASARLRILARELGRGREGLGW